MPQTGISKSVEQTCQLMTDNDDREEEHNGDNEACLARLGPTFLQLLATCSVEGSGLLEQLRLVYSHPRGAQGFDYPSTLRFERIEFI